MNRPQWFDRWLSIHCPSWWIPDFCVNRMAFWALLIGASVGAATSWYLNYVPPPWLEIRDVRAIYVRGGQEIIITGIYHANKVCSRVEESTEPGAGDPLVWRQEVVGTGPEIVQYAPEPEPPVLELGTHKFRTLIPLSAGISPDGWEVAVLVSCGNEAIAIRSRSVLVEFVNREP